MSNSLFSRRDFSRTIGSLALAFAAPSLPLRLDDTGDLPASEKTIHLNFNENPYGPSPKALQALDSCGPVAARYPHTTYLQLIDALAKNYGISRENIALGCGSTEILRCVDMAFLGPGKNVVAAQTFRKWLLRALPRLASSMFATPIILRARLLRAKNWRLSSPLFLLPL